MEKHWLIPPPLPPEVSERLSAFPLLIRQVLYNRGISDPENARTFFHALPPEETSPFLLGGVEQAAVRIQEAIARGERLAIYGDYDVDGVTATVLLVEALQALGGQVQPYIPDRFDEGYGINVEALDRLKGDGVSLVISVDCGIRSLAEASHGRRIGLDLIITDHHTPASELPDCLAVIDPKVNGDVYPFKMLAGVGVAYKLAQALFIRAGKTREMGDRWLDLVALGTVADLAPLTGENRFLVRKGLESIHADARPGLQALCRVAGIDPRSLNSTHIGFAIGPRLNASGRMESARAAYELLSAAEPDPALVLAGLLQERNRQRQEETRRVVDQALGLVQAEGGGQDLLFVTHPDFSEGIVGLAASRLAEQFYRPAVVGRQAEDTTRCSCRSIPEFDITRALDECAELMEHHGGHAAAAGFTVRSGNLPALRERLRAVAARELGGRDLVPVLRAEAEVRLSDLGMDIFQGLQRFQPFGYQNPEVLLVTRGLRLSAVREVGQDGRHLRLTLTDGWLSVNAIAFNQGAWKAPLQAAGRADFLYVYETNEYNGRVDFQLNIKDIQLPS